jgi:hypothetical protein
MATAPAANRVTVASRIALAKDMLSLLRDGTLVLLFLLLILIPSFIGERLVSAGFEEGEFVGFKWKKQANAFGKSALELDAELKGAKDTVTRLTAQLRENEAELSRLRQSNLPPDADERLATLQSDNRKLAEQSASQVASIGATLASSRQVVAQARQVTAAGSPLALILGGDASLADAQNEVRAFTRAGIGNLAIYRKDGSFRTVAVTDSQATANEWRGKAAARRPDAYIVSFESWCPAPRPQPNYIQC